MRHLKALHVFHIAAESESYSAAAIKLHITHGAVSKQIKLLESYLSRALFYKQGRHVYLTQEGQLLKRYTDVGFHALHQGVDKVIHTERDHLEISCEPTLTMRWLMPRLSAYYQQSGIDVRLSTAGGPVVLSQMDLSMAIRRNDFAIPPDYRCDLLVEEWVGPVFSPAYWREIQGDLNQAIRLHSETRPDAWEHWFKQSGFTLSGSKKPGSKKPESKQSGLKQSEFDHSEATIARDSLDTYVSQQTFEHFYFCLQAVVDGLGAAMGSYPLVMDDLASGRLVAPLGFVLSGYHYVLIHPSAVFGRREASFAHWLTEQLSPCVPT